MLAVLLVIALVIGAVGGYLVTTSLNNNAFSSYNDNYGGAIDDSLNGFFTRAPLVAGFTRNQSTAPFTGQIAWYWLGGGTNAPLYPIYFFNYPKGPPVRGQYPILDGKPGLSGYTHF